jgi:hypothetical protein
VDPYTLAERIVEAVMRALDHDTMDNWDNEEDYETTRDELILIVEKILDRDRQSR